MKTVSKLFFLVALLAGCSDQVMVNDVGTSSSTETSTDGDSLDTSGSDGTGSSTNTSSGTGGGPTDSDGCVDVDNDGWCLPFDCDDDNPNVNPASEEIPDNDIDDNCDGRTDEVDDTDTDTGAPYPGSVDTVFNMGSLIIPMDLTYQDHGMLKAYGLVHQLLQNQIKVYWLIKAPKELNEADFVASALDVATGAAISDHGYRGGPFAISALDALAALDVIETWQKEHVTTVHQVTEKFTGPVSRILRRAPRAGIMATGGAELISFDYMRAAGIPDSTGKEWPTKVDKTGAYAAYPDVLSIADVRGPTDTVHNDGALFDQNGEPAFCELMTMHWDVKDRDEGAIAEIREYLRFPVHFYAQCQSVNAVENAENGRFLTPNGYIMDERPDQVEIIAPYLPFSQMDGGFETVGGSEPSYSLPPGDSYYDSGVVMVTEAGTPIGTRDVWMTGYLDGECKINDVVPVNLDFPWSPPPSVECPGKISYLAGHRYSTQMPMSDNLDAQGTRFFLNALFEADCVTAP